MRSSWVTRRRFVGGGSTLGLGAAAATLAACGGGNNNAKPSAAAAQPTATRAGEANPPATASGTAAAVTAGVSTPAAAAPKQGGELHLAVQASMGAQSMDPHISLNKAHRYWNLFSNLLIQPDHHSLEPLQGLLVEKWEQPDPSTLITHVRPGVTWHEGKITSGRPFISKDVAFNLMRMAGKLDPQHKALYQRASLLDGMDNALAIDATTTRISFTTPNASFLAGLADFRQLVVPPELVDKDPDFKNVKDFAGTGPFIIQDYDELTYSASYVANRKYWKPGQPYLDSVKQLSFSDITTELSAFITGRTHVFTTENVPSNRDTTKKGRADARILEWEFITFSYLGLNQTRGAFQDPRVRKALQLAFDYKEINDNAYGQGYYDYTGTLTSALPGTWTSEQVKKLAGWNPDTKHQDLTDATKLLDAAGFSTGKGINFTWFISAGGDPSIQTGQLQKAFPGISIRVQPAADGAAFSNRLVVGDYDLVSYAIQSPPGAILLAQVLYHTGGSRNYTKFSDPEIDALIDKGAVEFDTGKRNQIIDQLQRQLVEGMYLIPTGKYRYAFGIDPKLRGFDDYPGVGTFGFYDDGYAAGEESFA